MLRPSRILPALVGSVVLAAGVITATLPAHAEAPSPATSAAASGQCTQQADGKTPSLAVQDACGDHAMGSSQAADSATAAPTAGPEARSLAATPSAASASPSSSYLKGIDISWYQGLATNWSTLAANGYKFTFIKATESTSYVNSYFQQQWVNAGSHGFLRGAYDFGRPDLGGGAAEAQYFYANGASLSAGEAGTLPPVLDIEETPGGACSGISQSAMASWISSWVSTIKGLTGRTPIIYTRAGWWSQCTGGNTTIGKSALLWVADWTTSHTSPTLPAGWTNWRFWQYSDAVAIDANAGDADVFNATALSTLQSAASYNRISGPDRYTTSVEASETYSPGGTVYVADGANFPDALSAAAAAGKAKAPVLLVTPTAIPKMVGARLSILKPTQIVVVGGTSAVSNAETTALAKYTQSGSSSSVVRVSGADRFATSAAIATKNFGAGVTHLYVASGETWPDALAASAAAAATATSGPLLLVEQNSIPASVMSALTQLKPTSITVVGGTDVVGSAVKSQLAKIAPVTTLAGANRYATAQQIATKEFPAGVPFAYIASGVSFPDALVGAPLAGVSGSPILMTPTDSLTGATTAALKSLAPKKIEVLGGSNAVSASVQTQLTSYAAG